MKYPIALVIAMVIFLLSESHASSHAHLKTQEPVANSVITIKNSPEIISLGFSEDLEIKFSSITLKGPDGQIIPTGNAVLDPNDNKKLRVSIEVLLGAGKYTVEWRVLSKDGHSSSSFYQFTISE